LPYVRLEEIREKEVKIKPKNQRTRRRRWEVPDYDVFRWDKPLFGDQRTNGEVAI
jgi:hypothetical protein